MKKFLALLLTMIMLVSLVACGGEQGAAAQGEDEAPKAQIDLEAEGEQKVSDERAAKATLIETRDVWLEGKMTFALATDAKTYEEMVEHIGCEASIYENKPEDGERWYTWVAEEDETAKFLAVFWETGDGWTLYSIGSTNLQ